MYNSDYIEEKLHSFGERLKQEVCGITLKNYATLYRHIVEADQMPIDELTRRAVKIKPLVRLDRNGDKRSYGDFKPDDKLVFVKPCDIRQSYLYNFKPENIVTINTGTTDVPLEVPELEVITSFTCYHRYGGYYVFFRPGTDEVLSQIPPSVDLDRVKAFEITVDSLNLHDIYDRILDRHVSTVILYGMKGGLPDMMVNQKVICDAEEY